MYLTNETGKLLILYTFVSGCIILKLEASNNEVLENQLQPCNILHQSMLSLDRFIKIVHKLI